MTRRLFIYIVLFLFLAVPALSVNSQEVQIEGKKNVEYNLKYPGIMRDHPLYFLKTIRDQLNLFLTRNYVKKAELLLQISDKNINSALLFSQSGKWGLSTKSAYDGEQDFMKIFPFLSQSKKQGVSPSQDFILTLKLSNEKHQEVVETIFKDVPQGERSLLSDVLNVNKKAKNELKRF